MPRDVAGVSRIGMFEQIVTPTGDTYSPTGGTATRVNLRSTSGKRITVSSCQRDGRYLDPPANPSMPYSMGMTPGVMPSDDETYD